MNRVSACLIVVAVLSVFETALADNRVFVESKTVVAGAKNVEVGVYLSNTPPVAMVLLPFEFREVTPGSYIADTVSVHQANRLLTYFRNSGAATYCSEHSDTLACWLERAYPDFVSPDMFMFFGAGWKPNNPCLAPGTDGSPPFGDAVPPINAPSLLLRFNVTSVPGTFVIDQTCFGADNMTFVSCDLLNIFEPQFTAGTITIVPCACECHGDPLCDGTLNIADVTRAIDEAFNGANPRSDQDCGRKTRSDINCDCQVDVRDVVGMIDVLIRGRNAQDVVCNGCTNNCP